ncbi:MAG: hypothetical protein IJO37_02100 [Ruminiclostridium sp.]|nr:hypothetical protein [Ruminiclostridium sp.]
MKKKFLPILLVVSLLANLVLVMMLVRADREVQEYHASVTLREMGFAASFLEKIQAGEDPEHAEALFDSATSFVYGAYQASYRILKDEFSPWEGLLFDLWNRMLYYPEAVEANLEELILAMSLEETSQLYDETRIQQMEHALQSIMETIAQMQAGEETQ